MMPGRNERLIVGCMSGTSLDGLDAALVRIHGRGLAMNAQLIALRSAPFSDSLRERLRLLASARPAAARDFALAARDLGEVHATLIASLCGETLEPPGKPDLVVAHGQTIWHDGRERLSWQLLDPWPIAHRLGVPVCCDLRQADLIAAGHGAPITPLADWIVYRASGKSRLIVNLGGVCNVTWLPPADPPDDAIHRIQAADVGPCNLLIDGVVRRFFPDRTFDRDGQLARQGNAQRIDPSALRRVTGLIDKTIQGHRTLGREQFGDAWLDEIVVAAGDLGGHDALALAVEAVARVIAIAMTAYPADEAVLCGGGARNPVLVEQLIAQTPDTGRILLSDDLGVPCEAREALDMAVLGALAQDGVPITLPQVTGRDQGPLAGSWIAATGRGQTTL